MRKISVLTNISLDGYFEDTDHGTSWATNTFDSFSEEGAAEVDTLLLGHRTYEVFKSFWPTPQAEQMLPDIAKAVNNQNKLVASHHDFEPGWQNVTVISGDVVPQIAEIKAGPGKGILILGSNNLVVSLLEAGLIDELQIVVNPVAIGAGTALFTGLNGQAKLKLTGSRQHKSGAVLLTYEPAK